VTAAEVVTSIQKIAGVLAVDLDKLAVDQAIKTGAAPVSPNSPQTHSILLPAILSAGQVRFDLATRSIQAAELLLINPRGITVTKKETVV